MKSTLLLLIPLIFLSCIQKENNDVIQSNELAFSINLSEVEHQKDKVFYYSEYFDGYHLVPLETNPDCLIGTIKQIKVNNEYIFVLDNQTKIIYTFLSDGKFKNKIGSIGRGPNEYLDPIITYDENNDEVIVYCKTLKKIIIYNIGGTSIKEFHYDNGFEPKYIENYNGNIYISINPLRNKKNLHFLLYKIDKNGNEVHKYLKDRGIYTSMEESRLGNLYKMNNKLFFYESYLDTIYCIQNDILKPYISTYSNKSSDLDEIGEIHLIHDVMKRSDKMRQYNKVYGRNNFIENKKLIHLSYKINFQSYSVLYKRDNNEFKMGFFLDDITNDMNVRFIGSNDDSYIGHIKEF